MTHEHQQLIARLSTACRAHVKGKRGWLDGATRTAELDTEDAQVCDDIRELVAYIRGLERRVAQLEASAAGEPFDDEADLDAIDVIAAREEIDVSELMGADDETLMRRAARHEIDGASTLAARQKRKAKGDGAACLPCQRAAAQAEKDGAA